MGRYTGFIALGIMMVIAAAFSLLPSAPADNAGPSGAPDTETVHSASPKKTGTQPNRSGEEASSVAPKGAFDFYVLALSWSPTFCQSEAAGRNRDQCGDGKSFGFVVHGLWPQNERGYPESCPTTEGDRVPARLGRSIMDIMPGMGLIGHQWRKHGSCSGLTMENYFKLVRQAFDTVSLPSDFSSIDLDMRTSPQAIEAAFIRSNPGLTRSAVAVTCDRDRIDEVRICLDKSLAFRPCQEVDRNSCRRADITLPPIP